MTCRWVDLILSSEASAETKNTRVQSWQAQDVADYLPSLYL
jgi:hypothetical protein